MSAAYRREQASGWSPYTQATHVVAALSEALREFAEQGGWRARNRLYRARSSRVREALAGLGIAPIVPVAECASMLTAFALPPADRYERIHDALKERGFVIYAGQGDLKERIFRIATMGAIGDADLDRLIAALRATFAKAGAGA